MMDFNEPDMSTENRFLRIASRVIGTLTLFNAAVSALHLTLIITALLKGIHLAQGDTSWPFLIARLGFTQIALLLADYLLFTYKPEN